MKTAYLLAIVIGVTALAAPTDGEARTRCVTMKGTHNGTDMMGTGGAARTATAKLHDQVDALKKGGATKVKVGKIRTSCGKWFIKYGLPHRHCRAWARVCYKP